MANSQELDQHQERVVWQKPMSAIANRRSRGLSCIPGTNAVYPPRGGSRVAAGSADGSVSDDRGEI